MPKAGDTFVVVDGVDFVCPFCQAKAVASAKGTSVIHALPPCEKFIALDVTQYLAAVNAAMRN